MDHASRELPVSEDESDLPLPPEENMPRLEGGIRHRFMDRVIARALPPNLSPDEEVVAVDTAEAAIAHVLRTVGVAALVLLLSAGGLVGYFLLGARSTNRELAAQLAAASAEQAKLQAAVAALRQEMTQAAQDQARVQREAGALKAQLATATAQLETARRQAAEWQQKSQSAAAVKKPARAPSPGASPLRPPSSTTRTR